MESGKGESCHPFYLPFTWMICCRVLRIWVLVVTGTVSLFRQLAMPMMLFIWPLTFRLMLHCCGDFAGTRGLIFNASKLSSFALVPSPLCPTVPTFTSSDSDNILSKAWDLIRKANLMLHTFSAADPVFKLQSYSLSLYGSALWKLSCPDIHSIKVSFNNILRRIWHFPHNCHTRILHLTALLSSLFNVTISRAAFLLLSALSCSSLIV